MKAIGLIVILLNFIVFSTQLPTVNEEELFEEKWDASYTECMKQYNITDLAGKLSEKPDGNLKNVQCFVKCTYLKVSFMNEDGELNIKEMLKHVQPYSESDASTVINKCKDLKGIDVCESTYKFSNCVGDGLAKLNPPTPAA